MNMALRGFASVLALLALVSAEACADAIPYPTPGVINPVTYVFTAASTGDIKAYFAGSTALFDNDLGLLVNGVDTGIYGLDNHSSPLGAGIDFGPVNAGDVLTFVLQNLSGLSPPGQKAYSNPLLNGPYDFGTPGPGVNHVYSTPYTGTGPVIDSIPPGTFVSFEDLPAPRADFNYNDEDFVFLNVAAVATPEPATLSVVGMGFVGLCGYAWRKRKAVVA
jgi:hypothetical protein